MKSIGQIYWYVLAALSVLAMQSSCKSSLTCQFVSFTTPAPGYSLANCLAAPEGDSWPCPGAGAFLVRVCESKSAGKPKHTVSSYFDISLDVRKQSSVLFPAPQPGEVGETGGGCRERQKEGRSKRSRKIVIIKKTQTLLHSALWSSTSWKKYSPAPQLFLSRDIQQPQELTVFSCNIQVLLHLQSSKKTKKNHRTASSFAFCLRKTHLNKNRRELRGGG